MPLNRVKRVAILALSLAVLYFGLSAVRPSRPAAQVTGRGVLVVMYHSILENPRRIGKYVCAPETLQADLQYLAEAGYTTVGISDLLAYRDGRADLPVKAVMLTFDDGFYNNYVYAFPMLQQYRMKAVVCVVGEFSFEPPDDTMNAAYSSLTGPQMREMEASGLVEIASHSYGMHSHKGRNGVAKSSGETQTQYEAALTADLQKLQSRLEIELGHAPVAFAYPFGAYSKTTDDVLRANGFALTLACTEGINDLHVGDDLYRLHRYNRPGGKSTEAFFGRVLGEG